MHFSIIASTTFLLGIAFAAPAEMDLRQEIRPMALGVSHPSPLLSLPVTISSFDLPLISAFSHVPHPL